MSCESRLVLRTANKQRAADAGDCLSSLAALAGACPEVSTVEARILLSSTFVFRCIAARDRMGRAAVETLRAAKAHARIPSQVDRRMLCPRGAQAQSSTIAVDATNAQISAQLAGQPKPPAACCDVVKSFIDMVCR